MTDRKAIYGYKENQLMLRFPSMKAAARTLANRDSNTARSRVHRKLREAAEGKRELYWGMRWQYAEATD
jgi:hypothetical protein